MFRGSVGLADVLVLGLLDGVAVLARFFGGAPEGLEAGGVDFGSVLCAGGDLVACFAGTGSGSLLPPGVPAAVAASVTTAALVTARLFSVVALAVLSGTVRVFVVLRRLLCSELAAVFSEEPAGTGVELVCPSGREVALFLADAFFAVVLSLETVEAFAAGAERGARVPATALVPDTFGAGAVASFFSGGAAAFRGLMLP